MRICVVGGGLAGSLLAWRLAQEPDVEVDLLLGHQGLADATSASGGAVRAYDPLDAQRELAIASMRELLSSDVLRQWADFREAGFVYLHAAGASAAVEDVERELPGSVQVDPPLSGDLSWLGALPPRTVVLERQAGYVSPGLLRDAVVRDLAGRRGVSVRAEAVDDLDAVAGAYDVVVLAVGAWTAELLRGNGLPYDEYRTKAIQYTVYDVAGWRPPPFCDDPTGLYAKPTSDGGLLLGVPTTEWDVVPGRPPVTPAWHDQASELAARFLPQLRLGQARIRMSAADCYCDPPILALRPVAGARPELLTFTGGSGGSVKTVLAASRRAAEQLVRFPAVLPVVPEEV